MTDLDTKVHEMFSFKVGDFFENYINEMNEILKTVFIVIYRFLLKIYP